MPAFIDTPKLRRGPRHAKSTGKPSGRTADLLVPAMASSYDAAEKVIQRMESQVTAFARLAATHPRLRDRLRKTIAAAVDVVRLGAPLPWSTDIAIAVAGFDGREDGPLAQVCGNAYDLATVKRWIALGEAEQVAREEGLAAARAWVEEQERCGVRQ